MAITETKPGAFSIRISESQWNFFFLSLLVLNGVLPQVIPGFIVSPVFMGLELVLIPASVFFFPLERQIKTLLTLAFIGYEYPLILGSVLFLFALGAKIWVRGKFNIQRPLLPLLALTVYALALFMVNAFEFVSFSGLIFWCMTFLGPWIVLLYFTQFSIPDTTRNAVFHFFTQSVRIQFPILLLQALNMRTLIPGDWAGGSMLDAHNCGVFIGLYVLSLLIPGITSREVNARWFSLGLWKKMIPALFFLALTDAKTIFLVMAVSLVLLLILLLYKSLITRHSPLPGLKIAWYTGLGLSAFLILPLLGQAYIRYAMDNQEADLYQTVGNYLLEDFNDSGSSQIANQKAVLYNRVFSTMKQEEEWLWWVGTGPGTFSSRAANTLAYDVLYKESQKIPSFIPPVSSPWTQKYLGDLMTRELVESVLFFSAVLAAPVSGIVALKAELGWPGLILFCLLVYGIILTLLPGKGPLEQQLQNRLVSVFWLMLPLLMVFDNYQEKPVITFPLMLLTALTLQIPLQRKP